MTENEAINLLQLNKPFTASKEANNAIDIAIQALSEIKQYRAIGTVEGYKIAIESSIGNYNLYKKYKAKIQEFEAIGTIEEFKALKEKNEPKEVAYQIDTSGHKHEKCPACGSFHVFGKHCTECGQSIVEWWK